MHGTALDHWLIAALEASAIPGLVAMVVDADDIRYVGAFGQRDVAHQRAMSIDTIFRIASMTKPVTSVAVQMLLEAGELELDDPVARYLPAYAVMNVVDSFDARNGAMTLRPSSRQITIRQLLTHTSGIGYPFTSEVLTQRIAAGAKGTPDSLPLLFEPGSRWGYGASTQVLGELIEAVTGEPLDAFLRRRLLEPLGMADTGFAVPPENVERVATLHQRGADGFTERPNRPTVASAVRGDDGIHATAPDYARFLQCVLRGGRNADGDRLLSQHSLAQMCRSQIGALRIELQHPTKPSVALPFPLGAGRDRFGFGFQVSGPARNPSLRSPGSLSWAGLANTHFWIDPARGIAAILLMQYRPFYDELAMRTLQGFEALIGDMVPATG
jgi:methyl acetate hydrolase